MKATERQVATIRAKCNAIGLDNDEMYELIRYLLCNEDMTLGRMDDRQAGRVIDALSGYEAVCTLMDLRPAWKARRRALLLRRPV